MLAELKRATALERALNAVDIGDLYHHSTDAPDPLLPLCLSETVCDRLRVPGRKLCERCEAREIEAAMMADPQPLDPQLSTAPWR